MFALDGHRGVIAQVVRRVVADLFDARERSQHEAAPGDALGFLQPALDVLDERLIERGLLAGERNGKDLLGLFRQVVDDIRVRLQPAQNKRSGELAQLFGHLGVVFALDGFGEVVAEKARRPQHPGVNEVQDGAHLRQAVLNRRAGQREAVARRQRAHRLGRAGAGVLNRLRLVEDYPVPLNLA